MPPFTNAKFRVPCELAVIPTKIKRILLIGACISCHVGGMIKHLYQINFDFVHINSLADLTTEPPQPLSDYDLQIVIPPADAFVLPATFYNIDFRDESAHERRFRDAEAKLRMMLDSALRWNRETGILTFVGNLLTPYQNPMGRLLPKYHFSNDEYFISKLNEIISNKISDFRSVYLLDLDGIAATFGRKFIQDDAFWSFAHGGLISDEDFVLYENTREGATARLEPLGKLTAIHPTQTDHYLQAVAHEAVASYRTAQQIDAVKIVIIDLDDTLWRGVAAEGQSSWSFLMAGWPLGFLEALSYLKKRGILLAIISKNDHEKVERVWNENLEHIFPLNNFVSAKINWQDKAENMLEILQETNLLPKSAVFIDDNPVERESMKAAFQDIRVLGSDPYRLRATLLWSPETQLPTITDESSTRTEMVQRQIERDQISRSMSREEFLASLQLEVETIRIASAHDKNFNRAFELLNKTNQFNTTGKRWTPEEITREFERGLRIYCFNVRDRFTKYGIVCVSLTQGDSILQFVMSCRVIGLGVELAALSTIESDMRSSTQGEITALEFETAANTLSRDLYKRAGYAKLGSEWKKRKGSPVSRPAHVTLSGA